MNESHPLNANAQRNGTQSQHPEEPGEGSDLQTPKRADTWEQVSAPDAVTEAFFLSFTQHQVQGQLLTGLAE